MERSVFATGHKNISLNTEVANRFGILPNFFCTASAAPGVLDELWRFAKSAYLDSPLPSIFKERLFVYLSRFCCVRYCIVRHVGFLIGEGHPAGDASARPQTVEQIVQLLKHPAPDLANMDAVYNRLNNLTSPSAIPASGTKKEEDLFDALAIMFIEPRSAEKARDAIKNAFGEMTFELVTAYLAFIRMAHYWTETHPEIACEPDMLHVMAEHKELSLLLLDTAEAERIQSGDMLRTVLYESQLRYKMIFRCISEAISICEIILNEEGQSTDFRFLEINPAFEKITGLPLASVEGKTAKDVFHGIEEEWIEMGGNVALGKGNIDLDYHVEVLDRWFHFSACAVGEKKLGQFVVVFNDITDRKRLEQQREDFLSIASHELKTPVTSIKAYGQLLQLAFVETQDRANLALAERMNAQVNRLNNQINDLLDTTRIREGQLHLSYEEFNLAELVRTLVEDVRPSTANHVFKVECQEVISLNGDKKRIEQVITNLISNAVKYSPGGGEISISCSRHEAQIEFSVKDNGIGIPSDAQEKIFDRFYRVERDKSNSLPGMGLGLYICGGIIHRHGGSVGVRSNSDQGSIFYFTLPSTPPPPEATPHTDHNMVTSYLRAR